MGNYSCAAENLLGESQLSNPVEVLVKCEYIKTQVVKLRNETLNAKEVYDPRRQCC